LYASVHLLETASNSLSSWNAYSIKRHLKLMPVFTSNQKSSLVIWFYPSGHTAAIEIVFSYRLCFENKIMVSETKSLPIMVVRSRHFQSQFVWAR